MKIHEIHLSVPSLSAMQAFYQGVLDLDFQAGAGDSLVFQTGLSQLHFTESATAAGGYHFAFNIPANQIVAAQAYLTRRGVRILRQPDGHEIVQFPNWHAQSVYFFDPAGNIVECIARRDLDNDNDRPFGPAAWLAVSEIGIVTSDVWQWRAEALRLYGIGDFDKQPASPGFSALGSDHGLFIVVPTGRQWFMTDIPATPQPLAVRFENDAGQLFTLSAS